MPTPGFPDSVRPTSRDASSRPLRRFGRRDDGSLSIFSIFMFMAILLLGGVGIDLMYHEVGRVRMQNTLDRAMLAAADLDQELDPESVVRDYFAKSNLGQELLEVTVDEGIGYRTVTTRGSARTNTLFIHMLGVDSLTTPSGGAAEDRVTDFEISLVLDISGTMRWDNRMTNLRPAARDFVSTVLADTKDTYVHIVPYSGQTNPGREMFVYLQGVPLGASDGDYFPDWAQDISNAVFYFDTSGDGEIDRAVKIDGFPDGGTPHHLGNDIDDFIEHVRAYIAEADDGVSPGDATVGVSIKGGRQTTAFYRYAGDANGAAADEGPTLNTGKGPDLELSYADFYAAMTPDVSSCLELAGDDFSGTGLPGTGRRQVPHFMNWAIDWSAMDWGWCPQDTMEIQYAQNEEKALHAYIDGMRMHDGTGTHYGMKWGLSLLDPATRPAFARLAAAGRMDEKFADRPAAWDDTEIQKIIVLMTDGQITEQVRPKEALHPDNAVDELEDQPAGRSMQHTSRGENLKAFYRQCELAKAQGVIVYTIAFEAPAGARTEMQTCASSPSHFFEAQGTEISDVFGSIASSIDMLSLIR